VICDNCKKAGEYHAQIDRARASMPGAAFPEAIEKAIGSALFLARQLHDVCPGGTRCDCQHRLQKGYAIDSEIQSATGCGT
jgi:hypothetical protein